MGGKTIFCYDDRMATPDRNLARPPCSPGVKPPCLAGLSTVQLVRGAGTPPACTQQYSAALAGGVGHLAVEDDGGALHRGLGCRHPLPVWRHCTTPSAGLQFTVGQNWSN